MQFVSITIDMLQIPEKLLLHRILSSCAKRICVARCLKLSLLLLKQIFTRKLEEFLFRKIVEEIISLKCISSIFTDCFGIAGFNLLFHLLYFVMSTILKTVFITQLLFSVFLPSCFNAVCLFAECFFGVCLFFLAAFLQYAFLLNAFLMYAYFS